MYNKTLRSEVCCHIVPGASITKHSIVKYVVMYQVSNVKYVVRLYHVANVKYVVVRL